MGRVSVTPIINPWLGLKNDEKGVIYFILCIKNDMYFFHLGIYFNNYHMPKSSGTMHTCDVKLK